MSVIPYFIIVWTEKKLVVLLDQQGDEATIEVIATFLPRVVVESLLAALKRANLEMEALTLRTDCSNQCANSTDNASFKCSTCRYWRRYV